LRSVETLVTIATATTTVTTVSSTTVTILSNQTQTTVTISPWLFTASINATYVVRGEPLNLSAKLTNVSHANQTIYDYVDPFINPQMSDANGTGVWAWDPSEIVYPSWTVASGQSLDVNISIPTTRLSAGHEYNIVITPFSIPSSYDMTTVLSFLVSSQAIPPSFVKTAFLQAPSGGNCAENGIITPCGGGLDAAQVFDCLAAAATPAGCNFTKGTTSPSHNYELTIWYPYVGRTNEPSWANCMYQTKGLTDINYGFCIAVSSTGFIVSLNIPWPPGPV
jgi:hypothetical protein